MSFKRGVMIGAAMLALGGLSWANAADPQARQAPADKVLAPARPAAVNKVMPARHVPAPVPVVAPAVPAVVETAGGSGDSVSLVAPPAELPRTKAPQTPPLREPGVSISGTAPAAVAAAFAAIHQDSAPAAAPKAVAPAAARPHPSRSRGGEFREPARKKAAVPMVKAVPPAAMVTAPRPVAASKHVEAALAPAARPGKLFSYVRLLNYSPHPQVEEFLKDKPLALKGKSYWFSVKYSEGWKTFTDEEGYLQDVSFEITLMEGDQKIRSLKTPKVAIKADKIAKGQVLGIAEVAPYKFTITVDQYTAKKKGIAELVFKLDLQG